MTPLLELEKANKRADDAESSSKELREQRNKFREQSWSLEYQLAKTKEALEEAEGGENAGEKWKEACNKACAERDAYKADLESLEKDYEGMEKYAQRQRAKKREVSDELKSMRKERDEAVEKSGSRKRSLAMVTERLAGAERSLDEFKSTLRGDSGVDVVVQSTPVKVARMEDIKVKIDGRGKEDGSKAHVEIASDDAAARTVVGFRVDATTEASMDTPVKKKENRKQLNPSGQRKERGGEYVKQTNADGRTFNWKKV